MFISGEFIITQVFISGNEQAVRIPKEFQFAEGEVEIIKQNNELIIRPLRKDLSEAFELLASLNMDGVEPVADEPPQSREAWS